MAKITRFTQKLFGSSAGANQIAEFGSFANGTPNRYSGATVTPALIQALSNYLSGWNAAVEAGNSPAIEDMNALCYLFSYQLGYLLQEGIAEWDAGTTYYIGSIVQDGTGVGYVSKTNSNLNNAVSDTSNWTPLANILANSRTRNVTTNGTDPGVGGMSICTSSGSYSMTSNTPAQITNQSLVLTTSGRPVYIGLIADGTTNESYIEAYSNNSGSISVDGRVQFYRDGTGLGPMVLEQSGIFGTGSVNSSTITLPPSSFNSIDAGANASAHTYTCKVSFDTGTGMNVNYVKMIAYEL
jgi:hypothetical protein